MTKTLLQRMETELDSSLYLCHDFNKIEAEFLRLTREWLHAKNEEMFINTVSTEDCEMSGIRQETFEALLADLNGPRQVSRTEVKINGQKETGEK